MVSAARSNMNVSSFLRSASAMRHPDRAAKRAALALIRSKVLALSTTKRVWVPAPTLSSSSLTATSNDTLRPSTASTRTAISTVMPSSVGARCLTATSIPTESSPGSACSDEVAAGVLDIADHRWRGVGARVFAHEADGALRTDGDAVDPGGARAKAWLHGFALLRGYAD